MRKFNEWTEEYGVAVKQKKQQSADGQSYKSTEIYKGGLRIYF